MDRSQTCISRTRTVLTYAFQVIEEETNKRCIEIFDAELGWRFAKSLFGEMQKQAETISISRYRMRACLPLLK